MSTVKKIMKSWNTSVGVTFEGTGGTDVIKVAEEAAFG